MDSAFQHGIASGDPLQDRVILWTRLSGSKAPSIDLNWEIAVDAEFTRIAADGKGPDYDQWDGYPVERALLLRKMRDHPLGNFVVLGGDIHVGLAQELRVEPFDDTQPPVAVECINTSITSQNFDDKMKWAPRTRSISFEQEMMRQFPDMKYVDLDSHGYNIVDVTPERVEVEWWYLDTVLRAGSGEHPGAKFSVNSGAPRLTRVA